jgi:hypothetical protein
MSLKLQLFTVSQQGTEGSTRVPRARRRGVSGGFMHLSYKMAKLGRYAIVPIIFVV